MGPTPQNISLSPADRGRGQGEGADYAHCRPPISANAPGKAAPSKFPRGRPAAIAGIGHFL
jgi:hypothetical protein